MIGRKYPNGGTGDWWWWSTLARVAGAELIPIDAVRLLE